jgi:hypothetical protein
MMLGSAGRWKFGKWVREKGKKIGNIVLTKESVKYVAIS